MNKYPIVILPGWRLGSGRFQPLTQAFLAAGYETYCLDFPGFEQGEKLRSTWNLTDYVKFLQDFLRKHKLSRVILVCHSFGGRVALKFTSQKPKKVAALILSGTPGYATISRLKLLFFLSMAKTGGAVFSLPLLRSIKDFLRKLFYKLIGARDFYHTDGYIRETFKMIIKEQLVEYMRKIRVPTLLLWGEKDQLVPVRIARHMERAIKKAKLTVIPKQSHNVSFKEPNLFAREVVEFLQQVPS